MSKHAVVTNRNNSAVRWCLVISVVASLLSGCAGGSPSIRRGPDYSTAYLGPNGEIMYASQRGSARARPSFFDPSPQPDWTWNGDAVSGAPAIRISLSEQTARFYKGGVEVGNAPVSTGREGYSTPTGQFSITQRNADHISNLYGDYVNERDEVVVANVGIGRDKRPSGTRFRGAPMPYFMRVTGGVGLHAGYLPGYAASHGCIRMPKAAAMKFFDNAPVGTPVEITP